MLLDRLKQHLMPSQFAFGALETAFNALIQRSPQVLPQLRKLTGKILQLELSSPALNAWLVFGDSRVEWLGVYEGEADCSVRLSFATLPKLADKQKLTELINNKSLVLNGDIQVLQHFTAVLGQLEKDPAELLSPFVGDVAVQTVTDFAQKIVGRLKGQIERNNRQMMDNLMNERPVLVHRLQAVDFYEQIAKLERRTAEFEQKLTQFARIKSEAKK